MSSIVFCLLLSCFTFHLGFVYPLQDVALHQCLHCFLSVAFLFQVVPSFLVMSSCHLLLGRPLDLFPLLGCHSVQRLVYPLSISLGICQASLHFCFSVYSMMSVIFVLFLISERGILSCSFICQGTKLPEYTQYCHCAYLPCAPRTDHWALQCKTQHGNTTTLCRGHDLVGSLLTRWVYEVYY